ncbi:MAG: hypothetical protein AABY07_04840 [Nanoarchaeota archaeon]
MRLFRNSVSYLEWEDYVKVIKQKELLHFLMSTTEASYRNLIEKEDKYGKIA